MERNDLEMMQSPERWPFQALPLKKYGEEGSFPIVGIMYYLDDGACKFHRGVSLFGPLPGADTNGVITTPEELVADGWIVD